MKLTKLKIENFRAIGHLEIDVHTFLTLIGPNNSGKSSVLRAIEIFINQLKPEIDEFRKNTDVTTPIVIEGMFEDIQEWERDKPGVSALVNENKIQLRVKITRDGNTVNELDYEAFIKPATIEGWADKWSELDQNIKEVATTLNIDGAGWKTKANKERIRQHIIENNPTIVTYGEAEWTSEGISIAPALKQAMLQVVIVHAVKDASDESKPASKTPFGILLKKVVLPAIQSSDEYQKLITAVENLAVKMKGGGESKFEAVTRLAEELTQTISTILKARVIFKIDTPDTDKFIGGNAGINLDDGIELPIYLQGHGAQRALIYALVESLARQTAVLSEADRPVTDECRSTILLFEEPEIYLHPHLMRRLKKSLVDISQRPDWQVIISTHSPFFINIAENPISLVIMSKKSHEIGVKANQLNNDPFIGIENERNEREALRATLDFHPTVAEVFFADKIVLVEGDTELAVLRHSQGISVKMGISQINFDSTTVISCGGKWTIPAVARILNNFGLSFRIIHDLDKKGLSDDELKNVIAIHPYKANEKIKQAAGTAEIFKVDDTFENILWPNPEEITSGDKPYKAWCRTKEIIDGVISVDDVPKLKEIFNFAYNW